MPVAGSTEGSAAAVAVPAVAAAALEFRERIHSTPPTTATPMPPYTATFGTCFPPMVTVLATEVLHPDDLLAGLLLRRVGDHRVGGGGVPVAALAAHLQQLRQRRRGHVGAAVARRG